jgi:hypothetical protein
MTTRRQLRAPTLPSRPFIKPIGGGKNVVRQEFPERRVVLEHLEELDVVRDEDFHRPLQRRVVLDSGVLPIRISDRVLKGLVRGHLGRQLLGDHLPDLVPIFPVDVPELVVERLDDVAQSLQFGLWLSAAATGRHWIDLGIGVRHAIEVLERIRRVGPNETGAKGSFTTYVLAEWSITARRSSFIGSAGDHPESWRLRELAAPRQRESPGTRMTCPISPTRVADRSSVQRTLWSPQFAKAYLGRKHRK